MTALHRPTARLICTYLISLYQNGGTMYAPF